MLEKQISRVGRDYFSFFFLHTYYFTKSAWLSLDVPISTDRRANSVDPDHTAPVGAL